VKPATFGDRKRRPKNLAPAATSAASAPAAGSIATPDNAHWDSGDLFRGRREIVIHHNGAEYRLRITAADKLILTK